MDHHRGNRVHRERNYSVFSVISVVFFFAVCNKEAKWTD
jgi:hypothetical protein